MAGENSVLGCGFSARFAAQAGDPSTRIDQSLQMPGSMDGLKLAAAVRRRWPSIKIVATSGQLTVTRDDLPSGSRFVPKPYSEREIEATLRELGGAAQRLLEPRYDEQTEQFTFGHRKALTREDEG
jgi:DNA-binding response OmpR family regulator